jgi:hypothetical protein
VPETKAALEVEERQRRRDAEQAQRQREIEEWKTSGNHPLARHQGQMYPGRRGQA